MFVSFCGWNVKRRISLCLNVVCNYQLKFYKMLCAQYCHYTLNREVHLKESSEKQIEFCISSHWSTSLKRNFHIAWWVNAGINKKDVVFSNWICRTLQFDQNQPQNVTIYPFSYRLWFCEIEEKKKTPEKKTLTQPYSWKKKTYFTTWNNTF